MNKRILLGTGILFLFFILTPIAQSQSFAANRSMPNVIGQNLDEAGKFLTSLGNIVKYEFEKTTNQVQDKKVFYQNPNPGSVLLPTQTILLKAYKFEIVMVTVPNVVKMSIPDAAVKLYASGLNPQTVNSEFTKDPNLHSKVSAQNPQAGQQVAKGSAVKLTLFVFQDDLVTVPNMAGLSPAKASDLVIGNLQVRWGGTMGPDVYKNGKIASHNPPAGTRVKKNSEVQITLQKVTFPNVIGLSLDAALQKLRSVGLDGTVAAYCINSTKPEGTICAAVEGAGNQAGSQVDIGKVISLQPYRRK